MIDANGGVLKLVLRLPNSYDTVLVFGVDADAEVVSATNDHKAIEALLLVRLGNRLR